jgi:rhodanese-related sulfurtransferase
MIALLRQTREQERSLVQILGEAERDDQGSSECWSIKDLIAHMAAWKQRHAEKLAAAARGETPPEWTDMELVDRLNAERYAADRANSWQTVQDFADSACASLIREVEAMSEADLTDPNRYDWQAGAALWKETLGNGVWHPFDHMTKLYLGRGNPEQAQTINQELADLLNQIASPPELHGNALYNLACLYTALSQRAQALATLHKALGFNPRLIEWARQDSDLVSLRDDPSLQALYQEAEPAVTSSPDSLISAEALRRAQSAPQAPIVIDVRGASEYAAGHVAGALNIPLGQLAGQIETLASDRPIVTYCNMHHRGESRGERAATLLRDHGYSARALDGGFPGWQAAGMPVQPE